MAELKSIEAGRLARLREAKPIRILVVHSNPDHYWCSCSRLKAQAYADRHGYALHWVVGAGEEEDPTDPVAAKWRKYKEALNLMDKSEVRARRGLFFSSCA